MSVDAISSEVEQLRNVATRLDARVDQNPSLSAPLTQIAGDVRKQADLLEILVAIRRSR